MQVRQRRLTQPSSQPMHCKLRYQRMCDRVHSEHDCFPGSTSGRPAGGRSYPDIEAAPEMMRKSTEEKKSGKDLWVHKVSIRNIGRERDRGLRPDPTDTALQMYVLGHQNPKSKKSGAPNAQGGEGEHYSIHGPLTVEALSNAPAAAEKKTVTGSPRPGTLGEQQPDAQPEGFYVFVDGAWMGPFTKIRVAPCLSALGRRPTASRISRSGRAQPGQVWRAGRRTDTSASR